MLRRNTAFIEAPDIKTFINNTPTSVREKFAKVIDKVDELLMEGGISMNFALLNKGDIGGYDNPLIALKSSYKLNEKEGELIECALSRRISAFGKKEKLIAGLKFMASTLFNQQSQEHIFYGHMLNMTEAKEGNPYIEAHPDTYVIERLLADNDKAGQDLVVKYLKMIDPVLSAKAKKTYTNFITIRDEQELLEKNLVKPVVNKDAKELKTLKAHKI